MVSRRDPIRSFALSPPSGSQTKLAFSSSGGAESEVAALACDCGLGVRENGCNREALGALYVHEVGVGGLD